MSIFYINTITIEGPDLSGKTTLYNQIHKITKYRWNIQDRSALSMLIHARYYGRDTFNQIEQLKRELYNLNNQMIICLPDWDVIVKRFTKRGDPIQNLSSLRKIFNLFFEAANEFQDYPNVTVIRKEVDDSLVHSLVNQYRAFERKSVHHLRDSMLQMLGTSAANRWQEIIGLNFVHYDTGDFADINEKMLTYETEKDYYKRIEKTMFRTIKNELNGLNSYKRKEDKRHQAAWHAAGMLYFSEESMVQKLWEGAVSKQILLCERAKIPHIHICCFPHLYPRLKNLTNAYPITGPITTRVNEYINVSLNEKTFNLDKATPKDISTRKMVE